jgi:FAD/FMN-containing dehydrogenase
VAVGALDESVALAGHLRRRVEGIQALELMTGPSMVLVARYLDAPVPLAPGAAAYVLVEVGAATDPVAELAAAVEEGAGVLDAAVATEAADRRRLWRWREAHSEAGGTLGVVHKLDVTLPASELAGFCDEVTARVGAARPAAITLLFGHVGDGNVHVNVVGPAADDEEVDDIVLDLVVSRGGSISAEHGIGTLKRRWLARDRSPDEVATMAAVKDALDPDGVLNPAVLLP